MIRTSVVVRTKDEAPRLRLVLASLAQQNVPVEIVVVNDGSTDATRDVLDEVAASMPIVAIHHAEPHGRSAASNAGAGAASGEVLLFLDGDTLAAPDLVARHGAVHAARPGVAGRGETYHLRGTRFFSDPDAATPAPGREAMVAGISAERLARMRVTRNEIVNDFAALDRRAEPGIYHGTAARMSYEIDMDALRNHPDCSVLWAAASGSNFSVRAGAFLDAGGFDEALDLNEHRELALRLARAGTHVVPVDGARTYHMLHRSQARDPLADTGWEAVFYRAHPEPAVKLLAVLWASLALGSAIPPAARIDSIPALEAASLGRTGIDYDAVRRGLGLPDLPA